jgi:glutamate-1-semialdehyde 2,1-aminomutase
VFDRYRDLTPTSAALHDRFVRVLPGGETRSVAHYEPYPVVIESGAGCHLRDVDGNEYVDVLNNYTSLVHGHAHPEVTAAIALTAGLGTVHPAPHLAQAELAELLTQRYPAVEQARFTNSGSEAAILAARLARHVTGRQVLVLADGGYHGTGVFFADPHPDVVRVPYNDITALEAALSTHQVAAVFLEPFLGSAGVIPAAEGYLAAAEQAAHLAGSLFVLDEIQAARTAYNGTHGALGLRPDLVLLGKIIGGGVPIGAVGGRADVLAAVTAAAPRRLAHSGTFNGNVMAMTAGRVALDLLTAAAIDLLNRRALEIATAIESAASGYDIPVSVTRAGSILHVHFLAEAPTTAEAARQGREDLARALHLTLLTQGIYSAPRGMLNLSTALRDVDVDHVVRGYSASLSTLRNAVSA